MAVNTLQRMIAVSQRARELLDEHELYDWQFEISDRAVQVGTCMYHRKTIMFSKHYLLSEWSEIEDTLLHELAHALVGQGHGHDEVWKAKARELGARPSRVVEKEKVVNTAKPNYKLECPTCGAVWTRHRLKRQLRNGALCPKCNAQLKIYRLVHK